MLVDIRCDKVYLIECTVSEIMPTAASSVSSESFVVASIPPCRTPSIEMGLDLGLGSSVSSSGSNDSPVHYVGRFSCDFTDTELNYAVFCFVRDYVG